MLTILTDMVRLMRAGFVLSRHDALLPKEYAHYYSLPIKAFGAITRLGAKTKKQSRPLRPGERLADALEGLGPFYVKTGQFMATRPDIIGFEMADDLGRLQDKMPPFAQDLAVQELEKTFGKKINDIFLEFSPPIAAASIAQAHKATLTTGEKVAVKILRPGIEKIAHKDFRALGRAAHCIEFFSKSARRMEPVKFINTLKEAARLELDLRLEAGAASLMADNLKTDKDIRIPKVIWPLSTKRILTIEWIDGTSMGEIDNIHNLPIDHKALAKKVIQSFLYQALHLGFFHADLHQGNIIIQDDGVIGLIDFGIMGRLDDVARRAFAEIIYGFINRDYQRTAQAHFDAGYISKKHSVEAFAQALRAVGEPLYGHNADQVDMSRVMQQLFDVTDMFDMHLRPELVLLQRTMVTVEGVARMLDPQINMWGAATPIVQTYIADRLGPKHYGQRLREATLKAIDIAPNLPTYLDDISLIARHLTDDHKIGLHNTSHDLEKALAKQTRISQLVLWFLGGSTLLLTLALLLKG